VIAGTEGQGQLDQGISMPCNVSHGTEDSLHRSKAYVCIICSV
jgi:hypothetical protein